MMSGGHNPSVLWRRTSLIRVGVRWARVGLSDRARPVARQATTAAPTNREPAEDGRPVDGRGASHTIRDRLLNCFIMNTDRTGATSRACAPVGVRLIHQVAARWRRRGYASDRASRVLRRESAQRCACCSRSRGANFERRLMRI